MIYLLGKDPAISSEKKQAFLDIFNQKDTFDTAGP